MTDTLPEVEEELERIWLIYDGDADDQIAWADNPNPYAQFGEEPAAVVEYVRADKFDQLQRDNAALREGLNICKFWFAGYADNGGKGASEELAMCQALLNPSNTGGR